MQRLPRTIENDFSERHINIVWLELKERFGFNIPEWKKRFRNEMSKQPRNVKDVDFFLTFANRFINPILNEILCRNWGYPTMNRLVEYVVRKK